MGNTAISSDYGTTVTGALSNFKNYNTYSTSEKWTGNYWIDGKKIYRKTVKVTANFTNPITIPNIDTPINYHGIWYGSSSFGSYINMIPYPAVASSTSDVSSIIFNWQTSAYFDDTKRFCILVGTGTDALNQVTKVIWILEYTKTTN